MRPNQCGTLYNFTIKKQTVFRYENKSETDVTNQCGTLYDFTIKNKTVFRYERDVTQSVWDTLRFHKANLFLDMKINAR